MHNIAPRTRANFITAYGGRSQSCDAHRTSRTVALLELTSTTVHHSEIRSKLWAGIASLVIGQWTLSLLDTAGKLLALAGYHVVMIAWMRYLINTVFMTLTVAPLYRRRTGKSILQSTQPGLQIARAVLMLISTLVFFSVLTIVPLSEGTAMNFCAPLLVLEWAGWYSINFPTV